MNRPADRAPGIRAATPVSAEASTMARARAPLEIRSSDPAVRWRLGGPGFVERTVDGGTTWQRQPTGVAVDLVAGASPGTLVCWAVGRSGAVVLTTDGTQWRQVTSPVNADLVSVEANDGRTATVTAADGRTFRTTDGGLTWR